MTDMLDYLGLETHEPRRTKLTDCLLQNRPQPDSHTTLQILDTSQQETRPFLFGTDCQHLLLRLPLGIIQKGVGEPYLLNGDFCLAMNVNLNDEC